MQINHNINQRNEEKSPFFHVLRIPIQGREKHKIRKSQHACFSVTSYKLRIIAYFLTNGEADEIE